MPMIKEGMSKVSMLLMKRPEIAKDENEDELSLCEGALSVASVPESYPSCCCHNET